MRPRRSGTQPWLAPTAHSTRQPFPANLENAVLGVKRPSAGSSAWPTQIRLTSVLTPPRTDRGYAPRQEPASPVPGVMLPIWTRTATSPAPIVAAGAAIRWLRVARPPVRGRCERLEQRPQRTPANAVGRHRRPAGATRDLGTHLGQCPGDPGRPRGDRTLLLIGHYQGLASSIGGLAIEPEITQIV